jgi:hypothetical protein
VQLEEALVSVECRRTLCKLELLDVGRNSSKVKHAFAKAIVTEDGFLGSFSHTGFSTRDGSPATAYVSRNHYSLPDKDGKIVEQPKVKPVP